MAKYNVLIPLIAVATYEVEADSEEKAIEKANNDLDDRSEIFDGYDTEPITEWWAEREE